VEPAYLSILEWPGDDPEKDRAATLAAAADMDPYLAAQAVRRGFPGVVTRTDCLAADLAVERLRERSIIAFAPRQSAFANSPPRIKSLAAAAGSSPPMYVCEMWRDEPVVLRTEDIFLIVRASLRASESRTTRESGLNSAAAGYVVAGLPGALIASQMGRGSTKTTRISVTEMLDLHLQDGSSLRIDADKFSFAVLGPAMGLTDRQNAVLLLKRLAHEAPRAITDTGFEHFRCPPDIILSHFSARGAKRTSQAPAFDFYSAWAALMYRAMAGPQ
jgi:hypothetical protein